MEEEKKKNSNWGGHRAGAGRPKTSQDPCIHKVSTALSEEVYQFAVKQAQAEGITVSSFIFRTLRERMKQGV